MVWDSNMAENASNEVSLLESIVPHDRKESALKLFAQNNYQIKGERICMILYLLIVSFIAVSSYTIHTSTYL